MAFDVDGRPCNPTLYVAHPLDLPPLTAQAAFDSRREGGLTIQTSSAELRLEDTGAAARLRRRGGLIRIEVEVEVIPWSDRRSEIGIRPRTRMIPMTWGWRQQRYLALAVEAAEGLARVLEVQVEDWLTEEACDFHVGSRAA
jgi:hypothetical protein